MRGGREILAAIHKNLTAVREIFAVDGSTGLDRRTFDRSTGGLLTGVQENFRQEYRRTFDRSTGELFLVRRTGGLWTGVQEKFLTGGRPKHT